jgi:NAD(P)-dependent dehydrogenase (short-subunit alcohol dehydrogenase family)
MTRLLLLSKGEMLASKTPLGRLGHPKDLKGVVLFLSSSASDYITGQIIAVDGGLSASF